ncbi:ABC transporter permease [Terriglobus roseus]|uniref:Putative ABC transport system permease protein n=1 Tax=Terriglobus roseus TaxID=392734 RepID=A0A1G7MF56_9BACT|nr:ABC transporter permease [Terriglobus roseus]SDF60306.1 putative ABC transport system permease protein [Terriglobus roseus]
MSWFRFFRRKRSDAELQEEMASFLNEEMADNVARGMSEEEARRQAYVKLGSREKVRESLWEQNSLQPLASVARDVKFASRTLRRTPGFSFLAVLVVALCIGAATSLFTIARSVLLRPLPFHDPDKLVMLYEARTKNGVPPAKPSYNPVSPADFYDWRSKTHGFEDMAVTRGDGFNLTGEHGELPESVVAAAGSWNLMRLLGVQPAVGRWFTEAEDKPGSTVVMLTWSVYQRRFGGDASIVGRQIHLDDKPYTVVGVLPSWFRYPDASIVLWVPYQGDMGETLQHHDYHQSQVIARMKDGVSLASAVAQVQAVQMQLHLAYPEQPVHDLVEVRPMHEDVTGDVKQPLQLMLGAVACMLLIGCLNVSNLMVARGAARQREVAIRSALGAQRGALIREQMTESVLICIAGGTLGVALSVLATQTLAHAWKDLPSVQSIHLDGTVIAFACALVCVAALVAGLLPALSSTDKTMLSAMQSSARTGASSLGRTALRKWMLTAEIAITVVLLVAAGLLGKSFLKLRATDVGCVTKDVLTLRYSLPSKEYDTPEKINAFHQSLLERVRVLPGVKAVALGNTVPAAGYWGDFVFTVKEHPPLQAGAPIQVGLERWADPGYFTGLGIPLIRGRFFTIQDQLDRADKVIISKQLADRYFPGEDAISRHLHIAAHALKGKPDALDYEIVGVVDDVIYQVGKEAKPMMYFPLLDGTMSGATLAVRTQYDPLQFALPVQKQIASLDPGLPVADVRTMDQVVGESLGNQSLSAGLVLAFAVLSLLLASVGLYGVLSYLAVQRTQELGIRMALGAQREQLLQQMLVDGMKPALFGLGLGMVASFAVTRVLQSMLFGTKPLDPAVLFGVVGTLLVVAMCACLVPAWRASRIEPMRALRME